MEPGAILLLLLAQSTEPLGYCCEWSDQLQTCIVIYNFKFRSFSFTIQTEVQKSPTLWFGSSGFSIWTINTSFDSSWPADLNIYFKYVLALFIADKYCKSTIFN